LKAGEKVVVEGLQKIKAGSPVVAKPWNPPAPSTPEVKPAAPESKPAAQPDSK
jgi:membrane fusion protein (multidrug efflux system)